MKNQITQIITQITTEAKYVWPSLDKSHRSSENQKIV
jgi:hypothetical protein